MQDDNCSTQPDSRCVTTGRRAGPHRPAPRRVPHDPSSIPGAAPGLRFLVAVVAPLLFGLHLLAPAPGYAQTAPSVPRNVQVTPGDGKLTLTWQAPSSWGSLPAGGYSVQWKPSGAGGTWDYVWEGGSTAVFGTDSTSFEFTGLQVNNAVVTNGDSYDLQIHAWSYDPNQGDEAESAWVTVSNNVPTAQGGDPPTVSLSAAPNPVMEAVPVTVTATLSETLATAVTIPLTLTDDTAEPSDHGTLSSITINARATSGTGTITTSRDADDDDETFTVALGSLPQQVEAGSPASVQVRIREEKLGGLRATLTASTLRPAEGSTVRLTVTLSAAAPTGGVRIDFYSHGTGNRQAFTGHDYTLPPPLKISAGERRATAALAIVDDSEPEGDETFAVSAVPSWLADESEIELTIPANDGGRTTPTIPTVSLSASPNPVTEGSSVTVTARLSSALEDAVTVPLTLARGTAEAGDHGSLAGITIGAGQTSGRGTITTTDDGDRDDETFRVALGSLPSTVRAGSPASVTVRIRDTTPTNEPPAPTVRLSASPNPVTEGSSVTVTATLSGALAANVTIPVTLTDGTAEPADYGTLASITINGGSTSGQGTVTTNQDADTDDETFTVALGSLPASVTAGSPSSVQVTISDDDDGGGQTTPTVRLSASPNPVTEGSSVTVTATLSGALAANVTIPVTLTDGTAEPADYGTLASITINGGSTSGQGTVTTNQDADTDDETFTVALGNLPASVTAGSPSSVQVTISDDDTPPASSDAGLSGLTISAGDLTFNSATTRYSVDVAHDVSSVTVTPTANHAGATITVNGTTAASGSASAAIALGVGENVIQVVVTAENGTTSRTYTVTVTRAALATRLTLTADPAPAEGGGEVTLTAALDIPAPADGTTVTLTTGGTATLDSDYTLSSNTIAIAGGETTGTATIAVIDDAEDDDGETIVLDAASVNPTLTAATLTLTIGDNDGAISYVLSASSRTVVEGGEVTITATASRPVAANTEVVVARDPASTADDDDFSVSPPLITIMDGDTEGSITLTATDDNDVEGDESLTLNGTVGGTSAGSVTLTIEDDDATPPTTPPTTLSLTADPAPAEGGGEVTLTATLDKPAPADGTTVTFTTGGTATLDADYTLSPTTVTIAAGETAATATITVIDDAEVDPDEEIRIGATSANPVLVASILILTIEDNEAGITYALSSSAPSVPEGGRVTIAAGASRMVDADTEVVVARDPASTAGDDDFSLHPPLITIMAGDTAGSLVLTATDDEALEGDESLTLNGSIGGAPAGSVTLTIEDDDSVLPTRLTLTADPAPVEGVGEITVTATLDKPAPEGGTRVHLTTGGTATPGRDYRFARSDIIRIAEGETAGSTAIVIIDDVEVDPGETIVLDATSTNPRLTAPPLTLTIEDNDIPVPALPVGGALLLGALLLWRGAMKARHRNYR